MSSTDTADLLHLIARGIIRDYIPTMAEAISYGIPVLQVVFVVDLSSDESALIGMYCVLLGVAIRSLFHVKEKNHPKFFWGMLFVLLLMFATSTALLSLDISWVIAATVDLFERNLNEPLTDKFTQFNAGYNSVYVFWASALDNIQVALGDSVVLWRAGMIFQDQLWIMVFPTLAWLASLGCSIAFIAIGKGSYPDLDFALSGIQTNLNLISNCLTLVVNFYVVVAVAVKAWQYKVIAPSMGATSYKKVLKVLLLLVEAGSAYLILLIFRIATATESSWATSEPSYIAVETVVYMSNQFVGIYPTAIIIILNYSVWNSAPSTVGNASSLKFGNRNTQSNSVTTEEGTHHHLTVRSITFADRQENIQESNSSRNLEESKEDNDLLVVRVE